MLLLTNHQIKQQFTLYTWTRRRRRTSTWFHALRCHPPKMAAGFQWDWCQKFSTLLWTPLARQKALSDSELCNARNFVLKVQNNDLKPVDFLNRNVLFWNGGSMLLFDLAMPPLLDRVTAKAIEGVGRGKWSPVRVNCDSVASAVLGLGT